MAARVASLTSVRAASASGAASLGSSRLPPPNPGGCFLELGLAVVVSSNAAEALESTEVESAALQAPKTAKEQIDTKNLNNMTPPQKHYSDVTIKQTYHYRHDLYRRHLASQRRHVRCTSSVYGCLSFA
jgi:hypothetical protein